MCGFVEARAIALHQVFRLENKKKHVSPCLRFSIWPSELAMDNPGPFSLPIYDWHFDFWLHTQSLQRHQPPAIPKT